MTHESPRRIFLKSSALAGVVFGAAPRSLMRSVFAAEGNRRGKTFVVVFQRGACDALNTVIPYADPAYRKARPNIAIAPPKDGDAATAIDLDGHFGLHPALADLGPLYRNGSLGIIHAVGSPDISRSHFDCQDFMESGTPGLKSTADGWMNRSAGAMPKTESKFRSVALTQTLPRVLRGTSPAVALARIDDFQVRDDLAAAEAGGMGPGGRRRNGPNGPGSRADRPRTEAAPQGAMGSETAPPTKGDSSASAFEKLYADAAKDMLGNAGRETFEAIEALKVADPSKYAPRAGVSYPRGRLGDSLKQMAQLIKADLGVELAFVDIGGWDHHTAEGGATGQLANLLRQFGGSLGAFNADLGDRMNDVVVMTMTEFGRTVRENGNRGTDHGHGSVSFLMGGPVKGGRVYGSFPSLSEENLYEGRDLPVNTDFRDVVGEVLTKHVGITNLRPVFPNYEVKPKAFVGALRS
jgi:uncharacterized protein (DUF1501 family)